ncbi:hypothetical protein BGW38_000447 [Lunasporangiospora selenospora]|uniref:Uncharacterized protein n=1 Tax=Lunasporangiospora selenospora TaxID=979761 RepID=A0A9P6KHL9_9FUNG|nr:hypothetical protein BGW38_000447 [Lunasporangiospora selenospora]
MDKIQLVLDKSLSKLQQTLMTRHPLVFSVDAIQDYLRIQSHIGSIAMSITSLYYRATDSVRKEEMTKSLDKIRLQFPKVPESDVLMLLEHALEAHAYRLFFTTAANQAQEPTSKSNKPRA